MSSWLDLIHEHTKEFESPRKFFTWSALAAISAVTKRNVYLRKRDKKSTAYVLYPNVYVFLVAGSGLRKGMPIKMARKLVKEADVTRLIAGKASMQGIIKRITTAYTKKDGTVVNDSAFFLCASEFRSSLIADPDALVTLTDWYDGDFADDWEYLLKHQTVADEMKDLYPVILGGSNPTHLKEKIQKADIEGGFIGRSYIVYADKKSKLNPLTDDLVGEDDGIDEEQLDYATLSCRLKEISKLKGHFLFTRESKRVYDDWYAKFNSQEFADRTGILNRLHDHVLKVAMLLSLAKKNELVFEPDEIEEAIELCNELAGNVNRAIMPSGSSAFAHQTSLVLQELLNMEADAEISKRKLLQKYWGEFDSFDWDRIRETLIQKDAVEIRRAGGQEFYSLKQWCRDQYLKFENEKDEDE